MTHVADVATRTRARTRRRGRRARTCRFYSRPTRAPTPAPQPTSCLLSAAFASPSNPLQPASSTPAKASTLLQPENAAASARFKADGGLARPGLHERWHWTLVAVEVTKIREGSRSWADVIDPSAAPSGDGCAECEAEGGWWLHLRRCAQCGHIGCCDTSPSQHATQHWKTSGHPVITSFEPGEEWFWNFETKSVYEDAVGTRASDPSPRDPIRPWPGRTGAGRLGSAPALAQEQVLPGHG